MDKIKYVRLENQDGSYSEPIPLSVDGNAIDINGTDLVTILDDKATIEQIEDIEEDLRNKVSTQALSTVSMQLEAQSARIDNLATLTDGSTTGDAELIDGRTGPTGVVYKNIGDAIRSQVSDLGVILNRELPLNICLKTAIRTLSTTTQVVSGNVEDGIHCIIDNSASDVAIGVRLNESNSPIFLKGGKYYRLYDKQLDNKSLVSWDTHMMDLRVVGESDNFVAREYSNKGQTFYVKEDVYVNMFIRLAAHYVIEDLYLFPVVEEIQVSEDNLINPFAYVSSISNNGITVKSNFDGTLSVKGTVAGSNFASSIIEMGYGVYLEKDEKYLISSNNQSNIKPSPTTYRLVVRPSDATTNLAYENFDKGILFTPTESGCYRIGLSIPVGQECDFIIKPFITNIKNLKLIDTHRDRVRVCAYNVGNFANGSSGTGAGTDEMYNNFIDCFKEVNADIYLFSEWDEYWNKNQSILAEDKFSRLKRYHSRFLDKSAGRYVAQMNYSNIPFVYEKYDYYADGESRHYTDNVCIINNKPIHFISTHFPWSTQALRWEDIDKVFKYIKDNKIEYYVLGGDFNMGLDSNNPETEQTGQTIIEKAKEDVDYLENKGCISAQGRFWGHADYDGLIHTTTSLPTVNYPMKPYDNIVVSPNIDILNVYTVFCEASDHLPIIVDLQIN